MIGVDWSEIRNRENNPILNTIQDEDIQKLEEFYDNLWWYITRRYKKNYKQ
jgi:hypothetical protein